MRCREHAKTILSAWTKGDRERVGMLLDQPIADSGPRASTADEEERRELLMGIKARLRNSDDRAPAAVVSLRLLRQLAAARG